jgi:hypothetical protein
VPESLKTSSFSRLQVHGKTGPKAAQMLGGRDPPGFTGQLCPAIYDPACDLNTNCSVLVSLFPTVVFWLAVPNFSCQAEIV